MQAGGKMQQLLGYRIMFFGSFSFSCKLDSQSFFVAGRAFQLKRKAAAGTQLTKSVAHLIELGNAVDSQVPWLKMRSTSNPGTSYFYIGLVLGCIDADLCDQILVRKLLTRCTNSKLFS